MLNKTPEDLLIKMRSAVESSMDGIALLNAEGVYYYLNEVHIKMFGYEKEEELTGKTWQAIYGQDEIDRINSEIFPQLMENKRWRGETVGKSRNGDPVYQEITLTILEDGGIICVCRDISGRRNDQQLLAENQLRLEMAIEGTQSGLYDWNIRDNTVFYSSSWKKLLGYEDHEINFGLNEWSDRVHPEDLEPAIKTLNDHLEGRIPIYEKQLRLKHKQGHYIHVLDRGRVTHTDIQGRPVRLIGIAFNITALIETREKLEQTEARWNAALEGSEFGVWDWDLEHSQLFFSSTLKQLYGYANDELEPSIDFWLNTSHPDEKEITKKAMEDHLAGKTPGFRIDRRVLHRDGSYRWFQSRGMVIKRDGDGNPLRAVGSVIDITETKKLEAELISAKELAEAEVIAKRRFLANISHEIRTPMHAIMGLAEQLSQTSLNEKEQQYISVINESSKTLLNIINDVIDISKIENGKLKIESVEFSLLTVLHNSFELFRDAAESKGLKLELFMEDELKRNFTGDPTRLRQVIQNILSNAVKFTEKGSISLRCMKGPGNMVVVECEDTGIGMTEKMKERLFQDFSQEDDSFVRKYGGSGLGLSITYDLVELMNGQISVKSEKGKGTLIRVDLPLKRAQNKLLEPEASKIAEKNTNLSSLKVLVAEDNRFNQLLIKAMLNNNSIHFDMVENGREAVANTENTDYDLILMDIQMPDMDGIEATRIIRQTKGPSLPIIAITANAIEEELRQYLQQGMTDVITKPFDEGKLIQKVREYSRASA